ncbi:SAM-dependent chlorinase/fluorinase [Patescibacteria group bacterium]|nr:SAM-dependent chlorinase/fluorinase [Patescibacteria group bacterium]
MGKNRIVVITDCSDIAANELRGVLISQIEKLGAEEVIEVEPVVYAKEFSIINAAFLVRLLADIYIPERIIFLVVVNPLSTERENRARIIGETNNGIKFVGENTGTLGWLIKDFGIKQIYESSKIGLAGKEFVSFGGKYIHAPIAAKIASGINLQNIGIPFDNNRISYVNFELGTVLHIDNFGIPKIFNKLEDQNEGEIFEVYVNGEKKCEAVYAHSMKALPDNSWAIYHGSSIDGLTEIGKVRSLNTAKELAIDIGSIITWRKKIK